MELTGLARSIDALFSGAVVASPPPTHLDDPPPAGLDDSSGPDFDASASVDEDVALVEAGTAEPAIDLQPPSVVVEGENDQDSVPADSTKDVEDSEEHVADSTDSTEAGVDDVATDHRTVEDPDEEDESTSLDLAVDAYIAGDLERAAEIKTLAEEFLNRKEIEPIARSVARLGVAAGDPPDASVYAVAESIMSPMVLGRLARRIGSERDEARRREYFKVCSMIGEDMAVAIRNDLADSTDRLSRRIHYDALIAMGDVSRKTIEEMATDDNRFLVRNAVAILGEIKGDRAVELVTSALANPDSRVRREALLALAKLGDEEAGELTFGFLEDSESEVRIAAAIAAGELRVVRALKPLIAMLEAATDPDESLPLIRALGQLGDPGAVASIEKHAVRSLFSKPRTDVRIAAYRALNAIGTPHARRLLNQAVSDKDSAVKSAVKEILHIR